MILGDAGRVRTELGRDPGLATQADTRMGWAPLHAASASRCHRLDPARAEGLLAVARMLLDAGADPNSRTGEAGGHGGWAPLRCAVAGAASPLITRLLLERGAIRSGCSAELTGLLLGYGADGLGSFQTWCSHGTSSVPRLRCDADLRQLTTKIATWGL